MSSRSTLSPNIDALSNFAGFLLATLLASTCVPAGAQTCASPLTWQWQEGIPLTIDTCAGEHVADGFCNGSHSSPGPVVTVRLYYDPACMAISQIAMSGGQAGFNPVLYLSNGMQDCAQGNCVGFADTSTALEWSGYAAGDYTLNITAHELDQADACGPVSLTLVGQLLDCNDTIFADGFDPSTPQLAALSLQGAIKRATR